MGRKNKKLGAALCIIGAIMFLFSIVLRSIKHEYLFRDYGYGCTNLSDKKTETFEIEEETKIYFCFYSKIEGNMKVELKNEKGEVVFSNNDVNFNKKYSSKLQPGIYTYSIEYSDLDGEFNISASKRTFFGIIF